MDQKRLHTITGFFVFFITALVYIMTVQPSVSFWDCGEFIASAFLMQVPHPPGTPFFLILGRFFSMIPFAENIAFRVNMVSVLSSAFTILFLYLVIVKVIENYKNGKFENTTDAFFAYISAAIGALSLAFADTFWFNAVEAEVYALSTFFIAFVTWMIMLWNAKADEPDNEKYLIMIAYMLGLSVGVHLMAVLAMVPIVMVIMFRKYITDEKELAASGILFVVHAVIIIAVALVLWYNETTPSPPRPEEYQAFDSRFFMIMLVISAVFMGLMWKKVFSRNSFYLPLIFGAIALMATYPGIVKYVPNLITAIGENNVTLNIFIFIGLFAIIGYGIYWTNKNEKETLNLIFKSFLFAFLGFTSYTMIMIRANQDTPINLNSPKTFEEVVKYLNREQYGDFPTFKRRFSQEPHQQHIYSSYSSDGEFLVRYQMNHMFHRYLLWNYAGRVSTVQDEGVDFSQLYAIPFLIGLFGLFHHFRRDWKMASIFLVMFIFLGYLTAFYQNQQEPQPRERDYFYVGAFFVYSIWIGLGARGILEVMKEWFGEQSWLKMASAGALVVLFIFIPANMLSTNYFEHDRSRNYVPWDYSYNLLQSVEKDAVIFTNGDNDTFPLWYLQDVEGVRRDVRIANLSLLNTPWYINQLKNTTPHGAKKVPMTMSDAQIRDIQPVRWEPQTITLPVPHDVYAEYGITDTSWINKGKVSWVMPNSAQFGNIKAVRVQDIVVLDIVRAANFERPVYFAVTCSEDSRIGLNDYMKMEGLALRIRPEKNSSYYNQVDEELLRKQLYEEPEGYSVDYQPGFKFRGLNDPTIFFDENHSRLSQNYRNSFLRLAIYYMMVKNDNQACIETLDLMEQKIPRDIIPMDYRIMRNVGDIYMNAGAMDRYLEISSELEVIALEMIEENPMNIGSRESPYLVLRDIYEVTGQYNKLVRLFTKLQSIAPNDKTVQTLLQKYRRLAAQDTNEVIQQKQID